MFKHNINTTIKHNIRSLLSLLLVAAFVAVGFGALTSDTEAAPLRQDSQESRTITVTGYGIAYGAPDIVRIGLGAESVSEDIATAMNDTNARMEAVIEALVEAGVAREDIRTESFSIYQDYNYGPDGPSDTLRYRVSTSARITVRDTENVGSLLASAVDAGANMVNYLQFDIADRAGLETDARDAAVEDARDRAGQLADTLGLTVGDAIKVVELDGNNMPIAANLMGGMGGGAASDATISGGQLSVSLAVQITFAVE